MEILNKIKSLFSKGEQDTSTQLPKEEQASFELSVDGILVGILSCGNGLWKFHYAEEFKAVSDEYNLITGFSDLDKEYVSETLWPFFRIRIPGLGQPRIRETLEKEKIPADNEVALLKRFGMVSISNPYKLRLA
ncbi:MAG: hypothetical protein H6581_01410 [Bacteroidia bacterium]|nr:hypothetical protein [Bacteroidia bacterium]